MIVSFYLVYFSSETLLMQPAILMDKLFLSNVLYDLYIRCFDSLMSRGSSCGPNNFSLCVYEPQQNLG